MTQEQWVMEGMALTEHERRNAQLINDVFKAFRNTLISVFGLNYGHSLDAEGNWGFTPLIFWLGDGKQLQGVHDQAGMTEDALAAANDKGLDELNTELAKLEWSDLEPLLFGGDHSDNVLEQRESKEYQDMLQRLGIRLYNAEEELEVE